MQNILFITSNRIGDAVLSTGLLAHLLATYPKARFTIVCGPAAAGLFTGFPNLQKLIVLRKERFARHWLRLWAQTVGTRWDVVVDLRRTALSYFLWTCKRYIQPKAGDEHRSQSVAATMSLTPAPMPTLWPTAASRVNAEGLLPDGDMFIGLGATANWEGKRWRAENFAAVVNALRTERPQLQKARIVIFGGPGEEHLITPITQALGEEVLNLVGKIDLLTARACIERCVLYVGNDTGITHVAATTGTPIVALFGPSIAEHYAPVGKRVKIVKTTTPYAELIGAPDYDHRTTGTLMDSIPLPDVVKACLMLLDKGKSDK
ncbi:MAG: glycosyltransferase family 9 protein [Proteobacteria bacterium]|nr:glycosyltransferase family 9 protein [Pseudomonadota bacterium]